jgi:hypothetical protein
VPSISNLQLVGRLWPALSGARGFWRWLGVHAVIYLMLLVTTLAVWVVIDMSPGQRLIGLMLVLVFGLAVSALPTMLLTASLWTVRRLRWIWFRPLAVVVVCLPPLCTTPGPHQLVVIVPVQIIYGLVLIQPIKDEPA